MKNKTLEEKKEFLEKYLNEINTIVSAKIGFRTEFKIVERKDYAKNMHYALEDNRNLKEHCGIMASAFSEVTIHSRIYWNEDNLTICFHFEYEFISGGGNGHELCCISVYEDGNINLWR